MGWREGFFLDGRKNFAPRHSLGTCTHKKVAQTDTFAQAGREETMHTRPWWSYLQLMNFQPFLRKWTVEKGRRSLSVLEKVFFQCVSKRKKVAFSPFRTLFPISDCDLSRKAEGKGAEQALCVLGTREAPTKTYLQNANTLKSYKCLKLGLALQNV